MQNFLGDMGPTGQMILTVLIYALIIGGMYFVMFRPQQKKRKQEDDMRKNLQIGDEITTIGGIVGKIIGIKEDTDSFVIESGSDKLRIKRWAIASCDSIKEETKSN